LEDGLKEGFGEILGRTSTSWISSSSSSSELLKTSTGGDGAALDLECKWKL